MDDLRTIVAKNVFLSITWEPIVPSSEFRAEQFRCGVGTIVPKKCDPFDRERVFFFFFF